MVISWGLSCVYEWVGIWELTAFMGHELENIELFLIVKAIGIYIQKKIRQTKISEQIEGDLSLLPHSIIS